MIKAPIQLQDLRRRIYRKAKADKEHRFWGIYVHIAKYETLKEAYMISKRNGGAPGIDGKTFSDIEADGLDNFLLSIRDDLLNDRYIPDRNLKVKIPKGNGKFRELQIPTIRDRVVQGSLKLILEAIFEADFCNNSYGFRPKRSPHLALSEVRRSILRRMSTVVDVDLSKFFDTIRHSILLEKIAKRVEDPNIMKLVKKIIKSTGKVGVPQGGPLSPLAANIYLNELDWFFDNIRMATAQDGFEAVNYHRFADDIVITVSGHHTKAGWAERALQRLNEQLIPIGASLNKEKTKIVNILKGEAFSFLGFDFRRKQKHKGSSFYISMAPTGKARKSIKAKVRDIISNSGAVPIKDVVLRINSSLTGWVNYFRVGNSSRAFSDVRDYVEMKIRTLLTRRKKRKKTSIGWRRWSNEYLYDVLGLFWDWKILHLKNVEAYK